MAGGPTDDDGWGDAADGGDPPERPTSERPTSERPTSERPTISWEDDAPAPASAATPSPDVPHDAPGAEPDAPDAEPDAEPDAPDAEPDAPDAEPATPDAEPDAAPASVEIAAEYASAAATPPEPPASERPDPPAPKPPPRSISDDDEGWSGSLAEAAGIAPPPPAPPRRPLMSRRGWLWTIATLLLLALLGTAGVLSHLNSNRLYLACGDDDVRAERGRWFPWGRTSLDGDRWKPFKLPGVCESRELDSEAALEAAFLELLLDRASALLASESPDLSEAETLIEQGLMLSRAPEHKATRTELERLRGDVEYWRGRAAVDTAVQSLQAARAHYDEAQKIGPRHAGDADLWVPFLDKLIGRLGGGPNAPGDGDGAKPPTTAPTTPVTPGHDAAPPATPVIIHDAGPPPAAEPDAGVPRGGVLL